MVISAAETSPGYFIGLFHVDMEHLPTLLDALPGALPNAEGELMAAGGEESKKKKSHLSTGTQSAVNAMFAKYKKAVSATTTTSKGDVKKQDDDLREKPTEEDERCHTFSIGDEHDAVWHVGQNPWSRVLPSEPAPRFLLDRKRGHVLPDPLYRTQRKLTNTMVQHFVVPFIPVSNASFQIDRFRHRFIRDTEEHVTSDNFLYMCLKLDTILDVLEKRINKDNGVLPRQPTRGLLLGKEKTMHRYDGYIPPHQTGWRQRDFAEHDAKDPGRPEEWIYSILQGNENDDWSPMVVAFFGSQLNLASFLTKRSGDAQAASRASRVMVTATAELKSHTLVH